VVRRHVHECHRGPDVVTEAPELFLAGVLVDDVGKLETAAVGRPVELAVDCPDVVPVLGPAADGRLAVEAAPVGVRNNHGQDATYPSPVSPMPKHRSSCPVAARGTVCGTRRNRATRSDPDNGPDQDFPFVRGPGRVRTCDRRIMSPFSSDADGCSEWRSIAFPQINSGVRLGARDQVQPRAKHCRPIVGTREPNRGSRSGFARSLARRDGDGPPQRAMRDRLRIWLRRARREGSFAPSAAQNPGGR